MEEIVLDNDIYESVDDVVSGPQEDVREDTAGRHTQGHRSKTVRRPLRVVALGLGMLCLIQMGVIIGQAVHYHSANNQLTTKYNNVSLERDQLKRSYYNLTLEKNHSLTGYKNLTQESCKDRLQCLKMRIGEISGFKSLLGGPIEWKKIIDKIQLCFDF